ncbi:diaminopimelate dehydrogenase [Herbivorax sp. ANBcel31]|uniref:diaminopimelate dehydrogenase n=1 Tax=Herbivorax sp. ANBcel31 TaxID=3069754 RepID=UPI0027B42957|nr:diaminopimelate dehydrogenase [Herbivorax sp. ANBcel31]MDQ2087493.1 diaminopimelate dehydrogenase [Herbivorax sp. ANBcel31]
MSKKIKIGIVGYGNLGRGVEAAIKKTPDIELFAVFTRRDPETLKTNDSSVKVIHVDDAAKYTDEIDVMILCGGSASDLPKQGSEFVKMFNTVDSFDTHAKIPEYFEAVDSVAKSSKKIGIISVGWDPGLFSMNRMLTEAILPDGVGYTFWGKGVSQGHSDAIRRVEGVKNGVQYTIPKDEALEKVRKGLKPELGNKDKHLRECFVVPEDGADKAKIENEIKSMPNYFSDYETVVNFISEEELKKNHSAMPHGGKVIRSAVTGEEGNNQIVEFSIKLDSNPEFTASVLVAYARATYTMHKEGQIGAKTVFDVPLSYLSTESSAQLRKELL